MFFHCNTFLSSLKVVRKAKVQTGNLISILLKINAGQTVVCYFYADPPYNQAGIFVPAKTY